MKSRFFTRKDGFGDGTRAIEIRADGTSALHFSGGVWRNSGRVFRLENAERYVKEGNWIELPGPPITREEEEMLVAEFMKKHCMTADQVAAVCERLTNEENKG